MKDEVTFIRSYDKHNVMLTETKHWTTTSVYVEIEAYKDRMRRGEVAYIEVYWYRAGMQTVYAHEV